jgi:L-alanine-DL-glutamate epimerase-like enolase superfamily enzyme
MGPGTDMAVTRVAARTYTIPTDAPESDGTITWDATTMVTAEVEVGGEIGFGYTYCDRSAAGLIEGALSAALLGKDALAIETCWSSMNARIRNVGRPGVASCAISAIDIALWDLKAKQFDLALATLLGQARERVPVYGSGGFTSYDDSRLEEQLGGWAAEGCAFVKMKVGREPQRDLERAEVAKRAVGDATLFVDANGAYDRKQALGFAEEFSELGVGWFEEPVSSRPRGFRCQ